MRRFSELRADLPGISANVLTQRLEGLEEKHLLVRRRLPPIAALEAERLLRAEGDPKLIARFLTLFPLPERVELHPE